MSNSVGMDAQTGLRISGPFHLRQSIQRVLATPVGSRPLRRTFGSNLSALLDQPINEGLVLRIIAASAGALSKWEPRLSLTSAQVRSVAAGKLLMDLTLRDGKGEIVSLEGLEL